MTQESVGKRIRRFLGEIGLLEPLWDAPVMAQKPDEKEGKEPEVKDPMIVLGIRFKPDWVIHPEGSRYYYWLTLVFLAVLYNILVIPLRAVFREMDDDSLETTFLTCDYIADSIYFLDIIVSMFTTYVSDTERLHVVEPRKLIVNWISSTEGKLDIICLVPFDFVFIYTGIKQPFPALRFNRFLKYGRVSDFLKATEARSSKPDIARLVAVLFQFVLLMHLNACLYYFLSEMVGIESSEYVYPGEASWRKEGTENLNDPLILKYTWSFYWSMHSLTMIGITVQPKEPWEFIFQSSIMIVSVMMFSQVLGNVSRTVLNASAHARHFRLRMDHVMEYLDLRGVGGELREKVVKYFEYQWMNHQVEDERHIVGALPHRLQSDMAMKVHLNTLKHVRIFQGVEPGLLQDLVLKLKLQIFTPGEYVCRKGDIGKELYIVKKGCLEVVSEDGSFVFARLGEGSVFGEISLLNMVGMKSGNRRTANVRSVGYADLFCLSKQDLWSALAEYPEGKNRILEVGKQILLKDNLLNVEVAEKEAQRQENLIRALDRVVTGVDSLYLKFGRITAERAAAVYKLQKRIARAEKELMYEAERQNQQLAGIPSVPTKSQP
ncbi:cGMP-gated cation channel alpha-1-like isoform X2 [Paramacrobiotus metropolitanus]|uniref:cGMP-gated cation channel alpha-1-like isoform X2 n=1 Tax=Paramacrobiotus metropolitanus TaxID=2943436 RepID=UPI0024457F87|nr:cGMP-gated cation channel alpha-1-like isoform X2 [Paramacrobiotus metropolitanus]